MPFLVIANGSKPKAVELLLRLQSTQPKELTVTYFKTEYPLHAEEYISQQGSSFEMLICIGGDGTVHECVNGVMQLAAHERPALLLVPRGTGNDFSRLFHPTQHIWKTIAAAPQHWADVMKVENEKGEIRYCGNIGDAGLGAAVVKNANKLPAAIKGSPRFAAAIMQTLLSYKKQYMHFQSDHESLKKRFLTIAFAKGKYFGSGIGIAPDAQLTDGRIHLTLIGEVNLLQYLRYLPQLKQGKKVNHPEVLYTSAKKISLSGTGEVELDGEIGFELPVQITLIPKAVRWVGELR